MMPPFKADQQRRRLWLLLAVSALIGALASLWTLHVASSYPAGWHDRVAAGISADGTRAFWSDTGKRLIHVTDLETFERSAGLEAQARHVAWSASGDRLLLVKHHPDPAARRFAWVSPGDWTIHPGPSAELFAQTPHPDEIVLFERNAGVFQARNYRMSQQEESAARRLFEDAVEKYRGFWAATVSPDGRLLGVVRRSEDGEGRLEVRRRDDWEPVLQSKEGAAFLFFSHDQRRLLAVRSTAALVALRDYDLDTATLAQATEKLAGQANAAAVTADGAMIAVGRYTWQKKYPHIELYATEPFELLASVRLPGERYVIDLKHAADGESLMAIGRSGQLWEWIPASGKVTRKGWVAPRARDSRWISAVAGLVLYAGTWPALILLRRRSAMALQPRRTAMPLMLLLAVCLLEAVKLWATFSDPMFIISHTNFVLVLAHVVLAAVVLFVVVSMAILSIPARWKLLATTAGLLALAAAIDAFVWVAATGSV